MVFAGLVAVIVAAATFAFLLHDSTAPGAPERASGGAAAPLPASSDGALEPAQTAVSEASLPASKLEDPQSAEQLAREAYEQSMVRAAQDFRDDLQAFVRESELLPAQDHEDAARELLTRVEVLEENGYLTAPEALALRLSLLRYALPPDDYRAVADRLVSDARKRAEQAERDWAARVDPKLVTYREREREIVEESLSMSEFPDDMTRQAYLRERLTALRSEIFSSARGGSAAE